MQTYSKLCEDVVSGSVSAPPPMQTAESKGMLCNLIICNHIASNLCEGVAQYAPGYGPRGRNTANSSDSCAPDEGNIYSHFILPILHKYR